MNKFNSNNIVEFSLHKESVVNGLCEQLKQSNFVDAILIAEEKFIRCHKLILSAMSPVLESYFKLAKDGPGPTMLRFDKEVSSQDLENLVEYCYSGITSVPGDRMNSFVQFGRLLKVVGFVASDLPPQEQSFVDRESEIAQASTNNLMNTVFEPFEKPSTDQNTSTVPRKNPKRKLFRITSVSSDEVQEEQPKEKQAPTAKLTCKFCGNFTSRSKSGLYCHENYSCTFNPNFALYTCPVCNKKMKQRNNIATGKSTHSKR